MDAHFRAQELARRTVEYHRSREAEHRSRDRYGGRFTPFPWVQAATAVLGDEVLEDEALVVALVRELGRQGCSEVALAGLELVLARGSPPPSKALFDTALLVCATEYQDERCLALLERMRSLGVAADLGSANLALTALCCRGRLDRAVELLGELREEDGGPLRPNSYTVLMILQACNYKRRGAYREAIDAVQALEAGGRPANEEVVEALLVVCEAAMAKAPSFESAVAVFEALAELHLADSTRVYNGLLGAAGRAGRWREAQALYAAMQEDDVPASLETHTALIQACVVGRALDHALDIFEYLVAGRAAHELVPASIATYNHLIHACHQAGMLEKALEIAAWVQKTGVEFDDETYEELMATIDVAQLWDEKAMKQALQRHPAVLPRHLRPAPYDAMRVMYLDHLDSLQQEELLALEKLGQMGSWAPKSLTKGLMGQQHEQMMRDGQHEQMVAWEGQRGSGGSAQPSSRLPPSASYAYDGPEAEASTSTMAQPPPLSYRAGVGGTLAAESSSSSASVGGGGAPSAALSHAPSMRQLLTGISMKRLAGLGTAAGAAAGSGGGAMSFRAPGGRAGAAAGSGLNGGAGGGSGSDHQTVPAPTGFNNPPSWAQLQVQDAATAGPGGTPFIAIGAGGGGNSLSPLPLALAVEPANLVGQAAVASLGPLSNRASARGRSQATAGVGPGTSLLAPGLGGTAGGSGLPPLTEPAGPGAAVAVGLGVALGSPRAVSGHSSGGGLPSSPSRPHHLALKVAVGGGMGLGSAAADFLPSPLPSMALPPSIIAGRRPTVLRS